MPLSPVVVILGPTGAGKSDFALGVAQRHRGEIINADSRQIYAGMDIGTDKVGSGHAAVGGRKKTSVHDPRPTAGARHEPKLIEGVPHYLLDILSPDQRYSAAAFRDDARRIIADIQQRKKVPIVVGGTGFYIRVLTNGQQLPNIPADPAFRAWADFQPLATIAAELRARSPDLLAKVDDLRNRRRVTRALEIARARGNREQSSSSPPPWTLLKLALVPPFPVLCSRIEARVDRMLQRGLLDEAHGLVKRYGVYAPGLQTPGYRQALSFSAQPTPDAEIRAAIVRAHRATARRQLVWLKKEPGITVVEDVAAAAHTVDQFLLGIMKNGTRGPSARMG